MPRGPLRLVRTHPHVRPPTFRPLVEVLEGRCLPSGGPPTNGPPPPADYGDGPDDTSNVLDGSPAVGNNEGIGRYPTWPNTVRAIPGRTAPYHTDLSDVWLGPGPVNTATLELDPFLPNPDDWINQIEPPVVPFDTDDGPIVVFIGSTETGWVRTGPGGDLFGPYPGCSVCPSVWAFQATVGAAPAGVGRYANVAVDWDHSGAYGDAPGEWVVVNGPIAAGPGETQVMVSAVFPVFVVGTPKQWAVVPFWSRFTVARETVEPSLFPLGWDGSGPIGGFSGGFGETEDWLVLGDPGLGRCNTPRVAFGPDAGAQSQVLVFDAVTLGLTYSFRAFAPAFTGGVRVTVADVNGGGCPDIIVGSGPGTQAQVRVFDGSSPGLLPARLSRPLGALEPYPGAGFTGGVFVAASDLNGDGRAEVIIAPDAGPLPGAPVPAPPVVALDGATGAVLGALLPYGPAFTGGVRVAAADVNGDARPDLVTVPGPGMAALVQVFSGFGGPLLRRYDAFASAFTGGAFVAAGDVNGDGRADVVVGAGPGLGARVRVFDSTADGPAALPLREIVAYAGFTGAVRVALRDINGDGVPELLTGPGPGLPLLVKAFNPLTGQELGSAQVYPPAFTGGLFLAG